MLTAYHPKSDGWGEVTNKIAFNILHPLIKDKHNKWAEHLFTTELAINSTTNSSTGKSPFQVILGFQPRNIPKPRASSDVPAALKAANNFYRTTIETQNALLKAKVKYADQQNEQFSSNPEYQINDQVTDSLYTPTPYMPRRSQNAHASMACPFKILARPHPNAYRLKLPDTMKIHPTFNVSFG